MTHIDRERVLLAKTAWTERYASIGEGDDPIGNHAGLRKGVGHEAFNFKTAPSDGRYYGYFRTHGGPDGGKLNLKRIDNHSSGAELKGVTVIWVSRPPGGTLRVVGWYRNATVYEETRRVDSPWSHPLYVTENNPTDKGSYLCTALADESVLLPVAEREDWKLPRSISSVMRRTDVLYPKVDQHSGVVAPWVGQIETLLREIEDYSHESHLLTEGKQDREITSVLHGQGLSPNPVRRAFIERTAMNHAKEYFEAEGYAVVDVSADHPFDLECVKDTERLQVEVKGTSGDGTRVILTDREFNHAAPTGWVRALYVLPQITELEGGEVILAKPRVIKPFNPKDYECKPISHFVRIDGG